MSTEQIDRRQKWADTQWNSGRCRIHGRQRKKKNGKLLWGCPACIQYSKDAYQRKKNTPKFIKAQQKRRQEREALLRDAEAWRKENGK